MKVKKKECSILFPAGRSGTHAASRPLPSPAAARRDNEVILQLVCLQLQDTAPHTAPQSMSSPQRTRAAEALAKGGSVSGREGEPSSSSNAVVSGEPLSQAAAQTPIYVRD